MANSIQSLHGEIWKPVVGYEGLYDVSNFGRVKSLARVVPHRATGNQAIPERVKKQSPVGVDRGYLQVSLWHANKEKRSLVHRLVLEAFVGPCPDGMECSHSDGNPANNQLKNLRWDTHEANEADKVLHGTRLRGERNPNAKITEADVRIIRARCARGEFQSVVAADYGINQAHVSDIVRRRLWGHV